MFNKLKPGCIRLQTRELVRVLDGRNFVKAAYDFSSDQNERTLQQSFRQALTWLPNVDSLLFDEHADLDPNFLARLDEDLNQDIVCPSLLSVAHCPYPLPNNFFASPYLQGLVYLDISGVPGSITSLCRQPPNTLPDLRVLKLRGRELGGVDFQFLVHRFRLKLWSLDITDNNVKDPAIRDLVQKCFPSTTLRSSAHFAREGKLDIDLERGSTLSGPFVRIEESVHSGSFGHPERYLPDAPMYHANPDDGPQEYHVFRSDGLQPIRQDSADAASVVLSETDNFAVIEDYRSVRGLTHLHLSNNQISAEGVAELIQTSNGHLENLSCDDMPLLPPGDYQSLWPPSASLRGIIGNAHIFRPVISSNLSVLRIHHSLVSHIPTLHHEGFSTLARLHVSENAIYPRIQAAFPQSYLPDMNPRLTSLTLTNIPRRSSGPLITQLVSFLKLLSEQERAIQDSKPAASSWRGPRLLKGLRHLRLEFEPDPMQEGFSASEDLDAEELMNSGEKSFSFFGNEWTGAGAVRAPAAVEAQEKLDVRQEENSNADGDNAVPPYSDRNDEEFMTYHGEWKGKTFEVPVWIGKSLASTGVIHDYRSLVDKHGLTDRVGPVTPAQVLAGAPASSYVDHKAWMLAVMPKRLEAPAAKELLGMRDVLAELKAYRHQGRTKLADLKQQNGSRPTLLGEPHFFWTGKLEVSLEEPATHSRPSQYWR